MTGFHHTTVLLEEAVDSLLPRSDGSYVDCTLGGAGHSRLILERSAPDGRLIALDQDDRALAHAREALASYGPRLTIQKANFRDLSRVLKSIGVCRVSGVLFDLGVSSPQLDEGERGFSYHVDAPLDMRMDRGQSTTAYDVVNTWSTDELTHILRSYGEEKWAARIAVFIGDARKHAPIETTGQLVELIKAAVPAAVRRDGPHPARRTFQAIRMAVNDELRALEEGIQGAFSVLEAGGRLAVITFHSLEDRLVKQQFASWAKACICPPEQPVCTCRGVALGRLITRKPVEPTIEEVDRNNRSRSAKLRVIERVNNE